MRKTGLSDNDKDKLMSDLIVSGIAITKTTPDGVKYVDPMSDEEMQEFYNTTHTDSQIRFERLSIEEIKAKYPNWKSEERLLELLKMLKK